MSFLIVGTVRSITFGAVDAGFGSSAIASPKDDKLIPVADDLHIIPLPSEEKPVHQKDDHKNVIINGPPPPIAPIAAEMF